MKSILIDFKKKFESVNQTVITKNQFEQIIQHISELKVSLANELPTRIFAKALSLYLENNVGRAIEIDGKKYLVLLREHEVVIEHTNPHYIDGSKVFLCETKEDAITAAALDPQGQYIEDDDDDEIPVS